MQTLDRAFAVLRALRSSEGSAGVSSVARTTGLPKSTVSRLLASLEQIGVVERLDQAGNYTIGPGLAVLAGSASPVRSLREVARPHLRDLVDRFGESAGLTVPDGPTTLYVDHVAAPGPVMTQDWTGMRFPFHTVAGGIAIMQTWSDDAIAEYAANGLERLTPVTATSLRTLMTRIRKGRRNGYVWTLGDFDEEIHGVAAPLRASTGEAIGAVTLYGPSFRFPGNAPADDIGEAVAHAAHVVSALHRSD